LSDAGRRHWLELMRERTPAGVGQAAKEETAGGMAAVSSGYRLWRFDWSRRRYGVDGHYQPCGGATQTAGDGADAMAFSMADRAELNRSGAQGKVSPRRRLPMVKAMTE
jgi:hypothetical protein